MKANELRIGNYIWLESKQKEYQISSGHDIEEIDDAPLNFDAKSIPLTEEWLLKFGFEWKNHGLRKSSFCIRQYGGGCSIFMSNESFNFNIELKYVHQLQNIYFALTGEELTFKSE